MPFNGKDVSRTAEECASLIAGEDAYAFKGCLICSNISLAHRSLNKISRFSFEVYQNTSKNSSSVRAFNKIYDSGIWGADGGGSGSGSSEEAGAAAKREINNLIFNYKVTRFIDAPCGAVHSSWMKKTVLEIKEKLPCFHYRGADVVQSVIDQNIIKLSNYSSWMAFAQMDLSASTALLPKGDMILSRDALQHLSYDTAAKVLRTYCRSGSKYLLVGSYVENKVNEYIRDGDDYRINLLLEPFSFPAPLDIIRERVSPTIGSSKYFLLYELPALCSSLPFMNFVDEYNH